MASMLAIAELADELQLTSARISDIAMKSSTTESEDVKGILGDHLISEFEFLQHTVLSMTKMLVDQFNEDDGAMFMPGELDFEKSEEVEAHPQSEEKEEEV